MILNSFFKALGQMDDRRFRRVLWLGVLLTIALLVAAYAGFLWVLDAWLGETVTLPGGYEIRWLDDLLTFSSVFLMLALSVFLMVPVASAITSMFLDEVAQAVEDRHYPNLPPVPGMPFYDALKDTVNFLGVIIAANVVALVVYAIFPPAAVFIFWALNGFLLGREYFTLAAMRRIGRPAAKVLRRKHAGTIWLAGILMAMPLSVPLINLVIPVLGAATFTHIFHALNDQR
ncbi:MAG: EI24 domain-containing protein [Marinibacterium sp.]|nr:EI24 domain-containing protein [Marinibacterium sp.]